ncbi:uncharacterized protein LOC102808548 [Saccoglossus kowalevskii]|uniref:Uncharacterized protein LOC102808548 n=1 Tax=Saccoglossus kowalevskii TaxID=10224 RepID=A0ABM0MVB0_SACKO|nr:PREDICTED: uncharacterized protein LOC102808548 [Saccoglossus kowalevskii]
MTRLKWNLFGLYTIDAFITIFVIPVCVAFYWRGMWGLLDVYLLPDSPCSSAGISLITGLVLIVTLNLAQDLHIRLFPYKSLRWYIYSKGFASVNHWRGLWDILDCYTERSLLSLSMSVLVASLFHWLVRTSRTCPNVPTKASRDNVKHVFCFYTRFDQKWTNHCVYYLLDMLLTYVIIVSVTVIYWRGMFGTLDLLIFEEDLTRSAWVSIAIGYTLAVVGTVLQYPAAIISRKVVQKSAFAQLVYEDTFVYVSAFMSVNVWRGTWYLCDVYILPDEFETSCWITLSVSVVVLYFILAARNMGGGEFRIDGKPQDGTGVYYEHYFDRLNDIKFKTTIEVPRMMDASTTAKIVELSGCENVVSREIIMGTEISSKMN